VKVFVQIPTYNEEETLGMVLESIPKKIPGVDLEILIIDDSSDDKTIAVAKRYGVKHFVKHPNRMGLARGFHDGVMYALEHGADIVVNTDGDNQYPQERIPDLIKPIMDGRADIVVADRQTHKIEHFSPLKKVLQRLGSYIVNKAAGTEIPDAASGFRAYSKNALIRLNIITQFSYTMETIIQAGNKRMAIISIPVDTNPKTRESRLFKNMWEHIFKSMSAIMRAYVMYKPYMVFATIGYTLLILGLIPFLRYFILYTLHKHPSSHVQSLLLGMILLVGAFLCLVLNIVADLIRTNRILLEETLEQIKYQRFNK
jgi:glycosyltransferase involved in cell wall biosynthesis